MDGYAQAWNLQYMHLSDDPSDADNWLVLCPHCLQLWPDTNSAEARETPPESALTGSSRPGVARGSRPAGPARQV